MSKALTELSITKIKPGASRLEVADGLVSGLYLIVQPTGKMGWAVRYRANGSTRKVTLGAYPAIPLARARSLAKGILLSVASGEDPAASRRADKALRENSERHFEAVARRYIAEYQKPKNRTWKEVARQLGLVPASSVRGEPTNDDVAYFVVRPGSVTERWRNRAMDSITTDDILAELDRQAPVQANRVLNTFKTLWKFSCGPRVRLAQDNPTAVISKPTPENSRPRVLSDDELRRLWHSSDCLGEPWAGLVKVLILTGQRRDEAARLPWSELDLGSKKWLIPPERAKNGREHLVHLSTAAVAEIARQRRVGDYVFSRGRTPVTDYSDAKTKLDQLSGVENWVFHDFRRTMATRLAELGVPANVVEGILNHASGTKAGVAGVYNRAELEPQRYRAINAWARYVALIVDARLYSGWRERVSLALDEYEEKLQMAEACLHGGTRWDSYLNSLVDGAEDNVVPLKMAGS